MMNGTRIAAIAVIILGAWGAFDSEAAGLLNDTGQTRCYALNMAEVPCDEAGTGDGAPLPRQDARFGRDAAAAMDRLEKVGGGAHGFDFTRICMNGDIEGHGTCPLLPPVPQDLEHPEPSDWACLRDNLTGLTYTLGNPVRVTWVEVSSTEEGSYIHRANSLARCGLASGWRVPTRREGFSLAHLDRSYPAVDLDYLPIWDDQQGMAFWSSDANGQRPHMNDLIDAEWGLLARYQCRQTVPISPCATFPPGVTRWESRVLLVNGHWRQSPEESGLVVGERWKVIHEHGIAVDRWTGLVWDRCTWGQSGPDCEEGVGQMFPRWNDAMQVARIANEQRYKGYYDWRMSNVRELETLVKIEEAEPAIDPDVFPNTLPFLYWTSTSSYLASPSVGNRVWALNFREGSLSGSYNKTQTVPNRAWVRLVRGGQPLAAFDGVSDVLYAADFESAAPPMP